MAAVLQDVNLRPEALGDICVGEWTTSVRTGSSCSGQLSGTGCSWCPVGYVWVPWGWKRFQCSFRSVRPGRLFCPVPGLWSGCRAVPSHGDANVPPTPAAIARETPPIDRNCVFAPRKRAAAWSWRFDGESCPVSKVNSWPEQGSSSPSRALAVERRGVRGCDEAGALLRNYSKSPFA